MDGEYLSLEFGHGGLVVSTAKYKDGRFGTLIHLNTGDPKPVGTHPGGNPDDYPVITALRFDTLEQAERVYYALVNK